MKETINNIHVISKGIVMSIVLHMIVVGFLVVTGFNTSLALFTLVLLAVMAVSGFYVGTISDRYAEINGLIIAIFTSTIVLLYIAQYTEMDWAVNRIIIASYLVIGFISSLISRLTNKKQKIKNKLMEKEQEVELEKEATPELHKEKAKEKLNIFPFGKRQKLDRKELVEEFNKQKELERLNRKKNS